MTSKLTREENVQAVFDLKAGYTLGLADVEILKRVARMALAAMDSEPVAEVYQVPNVGICAALGPSIRMLCALEPGTKLYRHAQQPVVPDDVLDALQKVARIRLDLNDFDGDCRGIADCLSDAEEALIEVVNRRAAMLQENAKSAGESNNCRSRENVQDLLAGNCRENGNSSTKHFREISETSTNRSREHFISLCNEFWNWQELDDITAGEEEPRLEWDGQAFTHRITKALWRMYQAAPGNSPVIPDGLIAEVNRLLDSDGSPGCYSAIRCGDAHDEIERLLATAPQEVQGE